MWVMHHGLRTSKENKHMVDAGITTAVTLLGLLTATLGVTGSAGS
jgi:hypothetical protein